MCLHWKKGSNKTKKNTWSTSGDREFLRHQNLHKSVTTKKFDHLIEYMNEIRVNK